MMCLLSCLTSGVLPMSDCYLPTTSGVRCDPVEFFDTCGALDDGLDGG